MFEIKRDRMISTGDLMSLIANLAVPIWSMGLDYST